jgi:hypothetical protein
MSGNPLGTCLRDRRARLDPAAPGFPPARRRTRGLRREEVAMRASISPAWYACLEQGRGGAPPAAALGRLARALLLIDAEREPPFLLGLGRLPGASAAGARASAPGCSACPTRWTRARR